MSHNLLQLTSNDTKDQIIQLENYIKNLISNSLFNDLIQSPSNSIKLFPNYR